MNHCALCGRPVLNPAVLIGRLPVGPKCAKRAGLLPLARRKAGLVVAASGHKTAVQRDKRTLDLFEVTA